MDYDHARRLSQLLYITGHDFPVPINHIVVDLVEGINHNLRVVRSRATIQPNRVPVQLFLNRQAPTSTAAVRNMASPIPDLPTQVPVHYAEYRSKTSDAAMHPTDQSTVEGEYEDVDDDEDDDDRMGINVQPLTAPSALSHGQSLDLQGPRAPTITKLSGKSSSSSGTVRREVPDGMMPMPSAAVPAPDFARQGTAPSSMRFSHNISRTSSNISDLSDDAEDERSASTADSPFLTLQSRHMTLGKDAVVGSGETRRIPPAPRDTAVMMLMGHSVDEEEDEDDDDKEEANPPSVVSSVSDVTISPPSNTNTKFFQNQIVLDALQSLQSSDSEASPDSARREEAKASAANRSSFFLTPGSVLARKKSFELRSPVPVVNSDEVEESLDAIAKQTKVSRPTVSSTTPRQYIPNRSPRSDEVSPRALKIASTNTKHLKDAVEKEKTPRELTKKVSFWKDMEQRANSGLSQPSSSKAKSVTVDTSHGHSSSSSNDGSLVSPSDAALDEYFSSFKPPSPFLASSASTETSLAAARSTSQQQQRNVEHFRKLKEVRACVCACIHQISILFLLYWLTQSGDDHKSSDETSPQNSSAAASVDSSTSSNPKKLSPRFNFK